MGGINGFDKDGQPLAVGSAAEADKLYSEGKLKFVRGQKINVKTYDGRVVPLNAEDYHIAREKGAVIVSDDEARTERKAEEIRDAGALAAFGRGAASTVVDPLLAVGANLGVTKDFRDISRDALKNQATDLEASEKEFAGATTGGKLFGYVAPTLLTAGANLGVRAGAQVTAKGLAAATAQRATVAGISNVAGETAAQLAVKGMAKLGAGKVATNVAKWSAQGAAEGVIQGASDAMVQATLDNPDKVAESMLMGGVTGGLYGAAGNVILGGIGKGLVRGATASKDAIKGLAQRVTRGAAQELGEVNPAVLGAAESATARYLGALDEPEPGAVAKGIGKAFNVDEADAARMFNAAGADAVDNPKKWIEKSTERATLSLDEIVDEARALDEEVFIGAGKLETIKRVSAGKINKEAALESARRYHDDAVARIAELAESAGELEKYGALNKLHRELKSGQIRKAIEVAAEKGDDAGAHIMFEVDNLKRAIGTAAKQQQGDSGSIRALKEKVAGVYDGTRFHLEDRAVWGDMADLQQEVNSGYVLGLRQQKKFNKAFREVTGSDSFEVLSRNDADKIKTWVTRAGEFEGRNEDDAIAEFLEGARIRADAYAKRAAAGDALTARAAKNVERINNFRGTWRDIIDGNQARLAAEKVTEQARNRAIFGGAIATGAGLAAGMGGGEATVGGGMVGAAIANPAMAARMLAAARVSIGKRSGAILGAAGGVSNRARGIFEKAGKVAPRAGRALAGGALFLAYKDKVREIVDATTNTATVPELDTITPGLSGALAAKRATALDFLKSKAPTGGMGKGMFAHLETPKVTDYEARRFLAYVRGVEDPMGVLAEVQSGNISPEAIEAVRTVYPETFAEMQQVVMEQLSGLEKPPPYESRLELFRLFGIAADPSLSPEFLASMQSLSPGPVPGQNPQKPKAGSSSSRLAAMSVSQTERTLTR